MDIIKEPIKSDKEKKPLEPADVLSSDKRSFIRTMEKDLAVLKKKGPAEPGRPVAGLIRGGPPKKVVPPSPAEPFKRAVPPAGLPVFEPAKRPEIPSPPPAPRPTLPVAPPQPAEGLRKEEEIKKRIEETRERIEEARRKAVAREKAEKERKPEGVGKEIEKFRKPKIVKKKKPLLRFVFISLAVVVVIGGLGGFIYWWNYLRVVTPVFHYECQDNLCLQVEGEEEDQCQIDADCQPTEPTMPASLIPVAETKAIELAIGQEDLLVDVLKTAASQAQAANTFKQVLVKLVSQTEKKYADLNTLLTALGVSLPDNVLAAAAASQVEGDNYTLFLYNQTAGNRLGLIIEMAQSETLVADLKNWEATMVGDLKPLFLEDEVPAAFTEGFQDNIYHDVAIRYLNFPDPALSIDYGIVAGKLILTTSRTSMYAAIEALLATEIDISDWQTYHNEEYGFEIKYPENFIVQEDCGIIDCEGVSFWDEDFLSSRDTSLNKIVTFNVFVTASIQDAEKYIGGHYSSPAGPGAKTYEFLNPEMITINQNEFLKKYYRDIVPSEEYDAFNFSSWHIENKGTIYTLIYNNQITMNPEPHEQLFNRILSTFKFVPSEENYRAESFSCGAGLECSFEIVEDSSLGSLALAELTIYDEEGNVYIIRGSEACLNGISITKDEELDINQILSNNEVALAEKFIKIQFADTSPKQVVMGGSIKCSEIPSYVFGYSIKENEFFLIPSYAEDDVIILGHFLSGEDISLLPVKVVE